MLECEDVDTGDRSSLSGVESASKGVCGVEVPEPPLDERRLNINSKKAWSADRHHHRPRCVHMRQKPKTRKRNKEEQGEMTHCMRSFSCVIRLRIIQLCRVACSGSCLRSSIVFWSW